MEKLMNTNELAEYLGIAASTIVDYRLKGIGPVYVKIGHLVRYRKADVDNWVANKAVVIS
ncbi:MAG: helix-turn-helix domain-containing protein [Alphaproteobacteria bacterium]|nr:helix-turn-helix domain-containing protein [Alphaproteobacteria bacterium]